MEENLFDVKSWSKELLEEISQPPNKVLRRNSIEVVFVDSEWEVYRLPSKHDPMTQKTRLLRSNDVDRVVSFLLKVSSPY